MQQAANRFVQENLGRASRFSLKAVLENFTEQDNFPKSKPIHPAAGLCGSNHFF
jgi:hypothetical protein